MSTERLLTTVLSSVFFLALASKCVAVPEEGNHAGPPPPREPPHDPHADKGSEESWEVAATGGENDQHDHHDHPLDHSLENHHLAKRFIWTLTQEPYFYEKYGGGEGGEVGRVGGQLGMGRVDSGPPMNPETLLPQAMPLRNPSTSSLHKRLYPRFYQAYVSKHPSFNRVASPVGEHKRFPPFHPLARFRGLSPGGSSSAYRHDYASFADHNGHRLPTAPNAQPSLKYESPMLEDEEEEEEEEGEEKPVRVGELLHLLKSIAGDRGLSGHTKSFRFGISRRK
ncbi:uncharacterized protein LOC126990961 isoform X1 [Eriocheir sinensis]|uniref:uncharacterized protein LOC126990961 isoform X1 n=1 Tax=Eriocheir sinensis TaxID=95602 RepID=UPI0021CAA5B5|nr:uncharacterized protein LOC126990961 isoform X1 [Eriocheir sinensis]